MIIDPNSNKAATVNEQFAQETRTHLSRSEAAEARRTINGMQRSYLSLKPLVTNRMMEAGKNQDLNAMKRITADLEVLEQMTASIDSLNNMVSSATIDTSRRTTEQERQEIKGLYSSGTYDQNDLADQYGLSQPAISKIVKPAE